METEDKKVKFYFEERAKEFDDIYDNSGDLIKKISNKLFRKGMKERFDETIKQCIELRDKTGAKSVLDIGCGAGRFAFHLGEKGFSVLGIDYSSEMINMANGYLAMYKKAAGKSPEIAFKVSDFMADFDEKSKYDISLALGVFDYVADPVPFIKKMSSVTKRGMIMSFPKKMTPQAPIRKFWLFFRKCPVYFYTENNLKSILSRAWISSYKLKSVSAGYQVLAEPHKIK